MKKGYTICPGIDVFSINLESRNSLSAAKPQQNIVEFNYCYQGRAEYQMPDGCYQYLGEGDLLISRESDQQKIQKLPLGYYQGLVFRLNLDILNRQPPALISDLPVSLSDITDPLLKQCDCLLLTAREPIESIFKVLFCIPEDARPAYYQLKVMELMLYLRFLNINAERNKTYTKPQVEMVKKIHDYLMEHLSSRFTIDTLAQQFCISSTTLKTNFKAVYGQPVMSYLKDKRIQQAAVQLRKSSLSIAEIAREAGYESQSKFGAAFKEIMRISPLEYRKRKNVI